MLQFPRFASDGRSFVARPSGTFSDRNGGIGAKSGGNRIPGRIRRQVGAEQIGLRSANLAPNTVSVPDQAADFERRKTIEVGANVDQLTLNFDVQGGRVVVRLDEVVNAGEEKPGRITE